MLASGRSTVAAEGFSDSEISRFSNYVRSLRAAAQAAGVSAATFDEAVAGLTPDGAIRNRPRQQTEFLRPIKAYVNGAVSPARVARGQAFAKQYRAELTVIETRFGVPREILLAIWGIETDFGRDFGKSDVLRSLLTQGFLAPEQTKWRDEAIAALVMIERRLARRDRLTGSWAGAMGHPQFLPSAYLKHAVSFEGRGRAADIWASVPDSLASIANFLKNSGWKAGEPWGGEVTLPDAFDYRRYREAITAWRSAGITRADGRALQGNGEAVLYHPVGAIGPRLLLQPNFFVLKAYNFSDAYALAVSLLADRMAGGAGIRRNWPDEPNPLKPDEIRAMQVKLTSLGLYRGEADGRIGPVLREAVHGFQVKAGLSPADGYPARSVWERMR